MREKVNLYAYLYIFIKLYCYYNSAYKVFWVIKSMCSQVKGYLWIPIHLGADCWKLHSGYCNGAYNSRSSQGTHAAKQTTYRSLLTLHLSSTIIPFVLQRRNPISKDK